MKTRYSTEFQKKVAITGAEPSITIDLRRLRKYHADFYIINGKEDSKEETLIGLARKLKEVSFGTEGIIYSTSSFRLVHISAGNTFKFAIYKHIRPKNAINKPGQIKYDITIWDDVRGNIFSTVFDVDDEGKIPQEVVQAIDKTLTRFTREGIVTCSVCKKEFQHWNGHGMHYDSKLCSEECAAKVAKQERDRSR